MAISQQKSNQELIARINNGEERAFKMLYDLYWDHLLVSAYNIVKKRDVAEDILQEIFINLWTKRGSIEIKTSLKGYLYSCVLYKTYDYFRKNKGIFTEGFVDNFNKRLQTSNPESKMIHKELIEHLNTAIENLPERNREVFKLKREKQLSNKEIAQLLDISIKTVEAHMTKSLRILKASISNIASLELIIFLFSDVIP
ncbi:RNA polymerase sigma-70 factor [Flavivirga spongiicola]|uniref:RNA polymerase sigma-70 factor n=1 Tax=Flavivirga spongiicola TaxID=421621 RepID=A0ABU7XVT3_9FLAO|nr:RNA polymerase sigma-70 factor [Flavivirga sp. MEBiC05379]MDO5979678.1 RNA polymerase sigma-70 factor [Flavivirga sp. MEBiC05379]